MSAVVVESVTRLLGMPDDAAVASLREHIATNGPLELPHPGDRIGRSSLLAEVSDAGLFGRGGATFLTHIKWETIAQARRRGIVVVNAMEGEPASWKDRLLLTRVPHLVLDGALVAARVLDASEIRVCVDIDNETAAASIQRAIAERARFEECPITVHRPPRRYIAGEESALIGWLERGRALPRFRTDKAVPLEVSHRPALVHNAETLCQVALIARHGASWFRSIGTDAAPGSTLVTVSGAVGTPGVLEVELGTPLRAILNRSGAPNDLSAVLVGGYGGAWLDGQALDTSYTPSDLAAAGATMGVGILVALTAASCGICETARIARYMAGQSAGQCGPCVFGLPALASHLEELAAGSSEPGLLELISTRIDMVEGRGGCRHPDGVTRLVRSALSVFADDAVGHARGAPCRGIHAPSVLASDTGVAHRR